MKTIFKFVAAVIAFVMPFTTSAQMKTEQNSTVKKNVELSADVVVCGGGLAGVCAAVSAARHGAKVVLVDGSTLTKLMIKHNVGVSLEQVYEVKRIDSDFFTEEL